MPKRSLMPLPTVESLLGQLRAIIQKARSQALRAVDVVQVQTCWSVGRHIVATGRCLLSHLGIKAPTYFASNGFISKIVFVDSKQMSNLPEFSSIRNAARTELSWMSS